MKKERITVTLWASEHTRPSNEPLSLSLRQKNLYRLQNSSESSAPEVGRGRTHTGYKSSAFCLDQLGWDKESNRERDREVWRGWFRRKGRRTYMWVQSVMVCTAILNELAENSISKKSVQWDWWFLKVIITSVYNDYCPYNPIRASKSPTVHAFQRQITEHKQ